MSLQGRVTPHTVIEKQRVLGRITPVVTIGQQRYPGDHRLRHRQQGTGGGLPRGGARNVKITAEAKMFLEQNLNDACTYTLAAMQSMLLVDCNIKVHTSTIRRHLNKLLYTVKQVRIEPTTCNGDVNKEKRRVFAEKLMAHQKEGNCIVYYDETNFNVYLKRQRGRAKRGSRAVVKLPPSKGANLQVQCAVSSSLGLVTYRLQRGSIRLANSAEFVEDIYKAVKASDTFQRYSQGKKVVIVLDNAPAHRQTEERVSEYPDMELLRLGPYSPMCNPIKGCFSVLKSRIKRDLALDRDAICDHSREPDSNGEILSISERQMRILERAATVNMSVMTPALVASMVLHCRDFVTKAVNNEDMVYGM